MRQAHGEQPQGRAIRALSIDGGGVRGLVPAMVLAEIEARTGKHIAELFDIVAGASAGSVLAVGLAVPGDVPGSPRWGAEEGVEIYKSRLAEVFDRSTWQAVASVGSLLREKYDEKPFEDLLSHYFGERMLSEAVTNVVVPAYDLANQDVLLFDSAAAEADRAMDMPMRVVVRGATAAPTYFEPAPVGPPIAHGHHLLVDGGIFANNPGICAFMQAQHRHLGDDVVLVSLGTGAPERPLNIEEVRSWGLAHWARPLVSLVMDGASRATDLHLRSLLGPERYFRLDPSLDGCSHHLDDASRENLDALESAGKSLIASSSAEIDRVCELLCRR
jgi:patatin-like phospholipase/acyl hydrolase